MSDKIKAAAEFCTDRPSTSRARPRARGSSARSPAEGMGRRGRGGWGKVAARPAGRPAISGQPPSGAKRIKRTGARPLRRAPLATRGPWVGRIPPRFSGRRHQHVLPAGRGCPFLGSHYRLGGASEGKVQKGKPRRGGGCAAILR